VILVIFGVQQALPLKKRLLAGVVPFPAESAWQDIILQKLGAIGAEKGKTAS